MDKEVWKWVPEQKWKIRISNMGSIQDLYSGLLVKEIRIFEEKGEFYFKFYNEPKINVKQLIISLFPIEYIPDDLSLILWKKSEQFSKKKQKRNKK
jgi:hypothetical protein